MLDGKFKKYYKNGRISFEGEYKNGNLLNGKINDDNGNIYEIKNWNGIIKEYHDNGKIKFEGKYLNGKKTGK